MSNAINEIDNTDLVFIFGYNPADSHPIVANHVIRAKQNGAKIIVCDPRKIETARIADMHIALKNGSNIALLNAMGHVIIEENLYDQAFVATRTEGFEEYKKIVEGYTPESVEAITGVSAQEIRQAARMYAGAKTAAILWGMGVTQFYQGVETVRSLTSLAMLTGNLGKAHVGVNPVRGQNNVQGACDMGALPDTYPIYIAGLRRSFSVAAYLTYALSHLECRPILLDGMGGMLREQISRIKARDIVVSISFSPYAEETVMVSETAASVGARQIVITDSQISPLATFSDLCFVVKEAQVDAFRSQSATLCLVQSLVVALAYRLGEGK